MILNISEKQYTPEYFKGMVKKLSQIHICQSLFANKTSTDLSFLKGVENTDNTRSLIIDAELSNIDALEIVYGFTELRELALTNFTLKSFVLDVEKFLKLATLKITGNIEIRGLEKIRLRKLSLNRVTKLKVANWGSSIEELTAASVKGLQAENLATLSKLKSLILTKADCSSLSFIQDLTNLEYLEVNYCSRLTDISSVAKCIRLQKIEFESCKKVISYQWLSTLQQLCELILIDCGNIESLNFINELSSLKRLVFTDTNIVDGDLTPCLRLESAWTSNNMRHYNVKIEDLPKYNK